MKYDFDEIVDRAGTDSLTVDGWREYMFGAHEDRVPEVPANGFINLWVADMAFSTPEPVLEAIRSRLDKKILGYTRVYDRGYYEIFGAWCERHYGYRFPEESIVFSPGIIPALNRLVPLLTHEEDSILILTPSYAPFKKAGDYSGRRVAECPLKNSQGHWTPDFEAMEQALCDEQKRIKVFFLCNPHNPTGRVWRRDELQKMIALCLQHDVWVISDEIHCDLSRSGVRHIPAASVFPENHKIITCMSTSKTFNLAGNLLANIMIPDASVRAEWLRLHDDFISPLSLVANKAAWSECDEWLTQVRHYIDENFRFLRDYMGTYHPQVRFIIPEGTYLAWIDISPLLDVCNHEEVTLFFARHAGVLLEGGQMFVSNGDGHIRLNLACPRVMLAEGLRRISKVLSGSSVKTPES
ncbi:MalY/PatB family protein (plasmid) [Klebsiella pneumoniae]|jgi:cystathionine beta-lyase|nr:MULTISPECIES: PatB family C-S lyase [Enterobacteriaceae]HBR1386732.1 PatB family C-S lyase [Klebsiella quasipneumoniae subsp. similipneumoniae]HCI6824927.1 PatB family C-S lyase [Klebsiella variicola subsp. variicola]KEY49089.1 aminotransferase [Citrobacter amalonaticus]MBA6167507.1 putative C-S lyase [Klebsiella variicola]MBA6183201.1 putative C-S lyase [Klebsiella variicola]